ncbi:MAG: polyprenyl synthetase family protein [Peptoniphilaceae bacterium]|jgi:geranylgeranyl diphosphate synthase type II
MTDYLTITQKNRQLFEQALQASLKEMPMHPLLKRALVYAVDGGGKRLRPVLLLESYALFAKDLDAAMPFAVSLEMIHNYSLVHDDLPAMDDDDYRRGRPSLHKEFDEAMGILAGDALLNGALELAMSAAQQDPNKWMATQILTRAAGTDGMLSGQIMDLYDRVEDLAHLLRLYEKKTGKLILAACEAGAVLGGATEEERAFLRDYAGHVGAAFQIQDDLLDAGQDLEADNMTILRFMTQEEAEENMVSHTEKALLALSRLAGRNTDRLMQITRSLMHRDV